MPASKLVRPHREYKDSFLESLAEYHGEDRYLQLDQNRLRGRFDAFVDRLAADKGYPEMDYQDWVEQVPETVLWLVKDSLYIGSVSIRHRLNWHLEKWGGHISFDIRPSMRGSGFGKKILSKAIPYANYFGIDEALLTVEPGNKAAIRIIEFCGGNFGDEAPKTERFPARLRYWIECV